MAAKSSFRRPPKNARRAPVKIVTTEQRVRITKTPQMVNKGFHPEASFLKDGWKIDEKSRTPDQQSFDVVISAEDFNKLRAKSEAKTRQLEGRSRKGGPGEPGVAAIEVERTQISGAKMRSEVARNTAANDNKAAS